jgi:hypothetical protein
MSETWTDRAALPEGARTEHDAAVELPDTLRVWTIRVGLLAGVLLVVLVIGELSARALGHEPWANEDLGIIVEPGGRFFETHPTLGYRHLPGRFVVRLRTGYSFVATHGPDTLRATHGPRQDRAFPPAPQVWIFGCSMTYGWSVNDWETYPWLLQQRLPNTEVVNFGVNGYGTLHSLIQFREALERGARPKLAVLAYAQIHDERNTFSRTRRKTIAPWNRLGPLLQPYARLDRERGLEVSMAEVEYEAFPLMNQSALSHAAEGIYNRLERRALQSRAVTLALLDEFASLSRKHGIPVVLAGIRSPQLAEVFDWARSQGVSTADISVNDKEPRYVNLPHDNHPSASAHAEYASRLHAAITRLHLPD